MVHECHHLAKHAFSWLMAAKARTERMLEEMLLFERYRHRNGNTIFKLRRWLEIIDHVILVI